MKTLSKVLFAICVIALTFCSTLIEVMACGIGGILSLVAIIEYCEE